MDPIQKKNEAFLQSLDSPAPEAPAEAGSPLDPLVPTGYTAEAAKALAKVPPELRRLIFDSGREIGEFEGINRARQVITMDMLDKLYQIKKSKSYRASGYVNWDNFCDKVLGCNHDVIDEQIVFARKFGSEFLAAAKQISLSRRVLRELRALPESEIQELVHGNAIRIDGEEIPLDEEHADEINEALESAVAKHRADAEREKARADVAARKIVDQATALEKKGQENEKLRAKVRELEDREYVQDYERRVMDLFVRASAEIREMADLSLEIQDEAVKERMFRMVLTGLDGSLNYLQNTVTQEFELPPSQEV